MIAVYQHGFFRLARTKNPLPPAFWWCAYWGGRVARLLRAPALPFPHVLHGHSDIAIPLPGHERVFPVQDTISKVSDAPIDALDETIHRPPIDVLDEQVHSQNISGLPEVPFVVETARPATSRAGPSVRRRADNRYLIDKKLRAPATHSRMPTHRDCLARVVDSLNLLPPIDMGAHCTLSPHEAEDGRTDAQGVQLPDCGRGRHAVLAARGVDVLVLLVLPERAYKIEASTVRQRRARRRLVPEVGFPTDASARRQRALGHLLELVEY